MAANSTSSEVEVRRRPARAKDKGVVDLAGDMLKEIATLIQTELQLLRAEISEKLTFHCDVSGADRCRRAFADGDDRSVAEAAIAGLVAYGLSWPVAILIIAALTLLGGAGLVWVGFNRLSMARLAPSKTLDQLQKDSNITKQI